LWDAVTVLCDVVPVLYIIFPLLCHAVRRKERAESRTYAISSVEKLPTAGPTREAERAVAKYAATKVTSVGMQGNTDSSPNTRNHVACTATNGFEEGQKDS
jgi:hypothetical protein